MATLSGTSSEDEGTPAKQRHISGNGAPLPPQKRFKSDSFTSGGMTFTSGSSNISDSDDNELERPSFGGSMSMAGFGVTSQPTASDSIATEVASNFVVKGQKSSSVAYSEKAKNMMAKMGYKTGTGLGKSGQGRVNPVETSKQKGRRGLGMTPQGFEQVDVDWRFDKEQASAEESVDWLPQCDEPAPNLMDMKTEWFSIGPRKMTIDDETNFCNEETLRKVLSCKNVFDDLEGEEMRKARTKSNPYETIRGVFFQNRAAMKMANMDAVTGYMFTKPTDSEGKSLIQPDELLYFCDVCAGPGGFSEYILWRRKSDTKGFGFTLKGPCDFKLEEFFAAPSEYFEPHYGVTDDGDIYNPENLKCFRNFVFENTGNRGAHFVMADGGFSVEGQENIQEILSKRLYLCQFLCALSVLREGGNFVCKLFDLFTTFSVGLVYLMYRAFDQVSIFKPVTSRPANSERYIICKGRRQDSDAIKDYMFFINLQLDNFREIGEETVTECVPLEVLRENEVFFNYLLESNESIGEAQAIALTKIKTFAQNNDLMEERQTDMRTECLKRWDIPDKVRTAPERSIPAHVKFSRLLGAIDMNSVDVALDRSVSELTFDNLSTIRSVYNYRCVLAGTSDQPGCNAEVADRWFLLGLGKSFVYKWNGQSTSNWRKEDQLNIELPMDTIIEVEYVQELRGEGKAQRRVTCVHIIDAIYLGGVDISKLHFNERHEKIKRFVKAITRHTRKDLAPIRVKDVYRLEEVMSIFDRLDMKKMKGGGGRLRLCYTGATEDFYIVPSGIYLIKTTQDPWSMEYSRSQKRKYFFNNNSNQSTFSCPPESIAGFKSCLKNRFLWSWKGIRVHDKQEMNEDNTKLPKAAIFDFIQQKTGLVR